MTYFFKPNLMLGLLFFLFLINLKAATNSAERVDVPSNHKGKKISENNNKANIMLQTLSIPAGSIEPSETEKEMHSENEAQTTFFKFSESISLRFGVALDIDDLNSSDPEDKEASVNMGFRYMFDSTSYKHAEFGLDFNTQPKFYLTGIYKFVFQRTNELRPHLGVGASLRFDEGDRLETPFDWESYNLYLTAGLEDSLKKNRSVRVDFDIHYGGDDFLFLLNLGHSWGID